MQSSRQRFSGRAVLAATAAIAVLGLQAATAGAGTTSGGVSEPSSGGVSGDYCTTTRSYPIIISGNKACAPQSAPQKVKDVIQAANVIRNKPYRWGGGHSGWGVDSGYDCSGAVSYALHAQGETGWLSSPLTSGAFARWGYSGRGSWITVVANSGHVWLRVGQPGQPKIRWDTSGTGGTGPSWHSQTRSTSGYSVRHPRGY